MSTDHRHLMGRPSVRAAVLASALCAVLGMSADCAGAAAFHGSSFGGTHVSGATSKTNQIYRMQRASKPKWTPSQRLGTHIVVVRQPPGNGDRPPPHRPPPRLHKPIIVGLPGLPAGPTGPVTVTTPPPSPPSGGGGGGGAGGAGGGTPAAVAATVNGNFVLDEVLVRFSANVSDQAIVNFAQAQRLALLGRHTLPAINAVLYRFRITDQRQVPVVIGSARGDARVALIQPNHVYILQDAGAAAAPTGDPMQYVVNKMHLPQAHDLATGERVLVAVVDSAIDSAHAELKGVIAGRFDTFKGDPAPHKHGTAMASAIAAHSRLLGVAPAAHILAVRAFDDAPAGARATTTRILDGLQWVSNSGARVVNMSFTGPEDATVHEMVTALRRNGKVLIAAAGNDGPTAAPCYPAAYPEVIAVTATDADDKLLNVANHGSYVAVAAPGVDIFVATPGGGYEFTTGTSVATAHVSGLVALLIARNPRLTPDAVLAILTKTAKDLGPPGRDDEFGAGLVDAYEALLTQAPATADRSATH
jgi:subtilisin family serine protease